MPLNPHIQEVLEELDSIQSAPVESLPGDRLPARRSLKRDVYVPLGSVEALEGHRVRPRVTSIQVDELDRPKSSS